MKPWPRQGDGHLTVIKEDGPGPVLGWTDARHPGRRPHHRAGPKDRPHLPDDGRLRPRPAGCTATGTGRIARGPCCRTASGSSRSRALDVFLRRGLLAAVFGCAGLGVFGRDEFEGELVLLAVQQHPHRAAILERAEQDLVGQRLLDVVLDDARQRPGAKRIVIALLAQPAGGFRRQVEGDVAVGQLGFQFQHEFLHHLVDGVAATAARRQWSRPAGCGIPA